MLKKSSKKNKDSETVKHGIISNTRYLYKELFKNYPSGRYVIPLYVLLSIILPVIATLIPSIAVNVIEYDRGIMIFVAGMGGIIIVYGILSCINNYLREYTELYNRMTRCYKSIGKMIYKSISSDFDIRESNKNQKMIGKANSALNSNWVGVERMYKETPSIIINAVGLILYGTAIITVDVRILIILLLMAVCNIGLNNWARNYMNKIIEKNSEIEKKNWYIFNKMKSVEAGKDARCYGMQRWFKTIAYNLIEDGNKWQRKIEKRWYIPVASDTIWGAVRDFAAYFILVTDVISGKINLTTFTLFLGIIAGFSTWFFGLVNSVNEMKTANDRVDDYRTVLDWKDRFKREDGKGIPKVIDFPMTIEFNNVSYRYEGADKDTISHLNLSIKAGEKIALVGENGAGKTTIVKLLCGLYHPTEGTIYVNGMDIEEYNIVEYYKLINAVFQDINPIEMTIANNISGKKKEDTDTDRLWSALKKAGLYDKVMSLPDKEDTYITQIFSETGIKLSGGETQKLMLARAIYKDAPIMILDEPTSVLDPLAESKMYDEYQDMTKNKTSIFISHRLASTRFCDKILFLEDGAILEEGTHEELLAKKGKYSEIYDVQSHYYKEEEVL